MDLTRRQFITLMSGSAATAVVFQACGVPEDELKAQASIQMPEDLVTGLDNWYATLCRQCPTSDGIVVRVVEGRAKKIEGNVDYPINQGKHSARCEAGLQGVYHPDRISAPLVRVGERGSGQWDEISWTDAVARLANQLQQLDSTDRVVMATDPVGSHLGMVVERFRSKLNARHVPYEPLERTNLVAAMSQVFNKDDLLYEPGRFVMPDFDIENTNYLLSFGADFLNTWLSPIRYARGYGHFRQGDRQRGTFVHADSRFSMTGANADEWLYVRPGQEGLLALSIAEVIISEGLGDGAAAEAMTGDGAVDLASFAPELVAGDIGVEAKTIRQVAHDFATNRPSLAIGGGSAGAQTNGLSNLAAIYSLNYLVGAVGQRGGVIFNPAPILTGLRPAQAGASFDEWFRLVGDMEQGRVDALLVRGADPMYGLPSSAGFRDAAFNVPLIVSFSGHMDDTTAMADLVLPEHNYLEDWGSDIPDPGPGHQMVGFQQPVVRPFFESRGAHHGTRGFADVLMALAQVMEVDLELPGETFMEVVQDGARQLYESGSGVAGPVRAKDYPDFRSFWNGALQNGSWRDESARFDGGPHAPPRLADTFEKPSFDGFPRDSDAFHLVPFASASLTDGRGAHLPWLQATPDPVTTATWSTWVEINMRKAEEMGIKEGDVVRVVNGSGGSIEALAYPHPGISPEVVCVPVGQGHSAGGRYAKGRGSNVLSILAPKTAGTGALAWAATRVKIEKTGRWKRLPKFEGSAALLAEDEEQRVLKVTPHDS